MGLPELWGTSLASTAGADRAMTAAALLASLRAKGISISSEGGRLILEAPAGVITANLRGELVKRKAELISALAPDHGHPADLNLAESQTEIAKLLATAYRRYREILRVGQDRPESSADYDLAKPATSSVHGVVP